MVTNNIINVIIKDKQFKYNLECLGLTEEDKINLKIKELQEHKKSLELALKLVDDEINRLRYCKVNTNI